MRRQGPFYPPPPPIPVEFTSQFPPVRTCLIGWETTDPKPWKLIPDRTLSVFKRELRISGTSDRGSGLEVSVDWAGMPYGPGEPVGPVLCLLGREAWRWQLQLLTTLKAASKWPHGFSKSCSVVVREVSRFHLRFVGDPSLTKGGWCVVRHRTLKQ